MASASHSVYIAYTTAIRHFIAAREAPCKQVYIALLSITNDVILFRGVVNLVPSLFGTLRCVALIILLLSH